ncbi:unnamed protein product [Hymenolepis diminuta]|uniref:Uncharacterized protein n=1 Tax=Hymenolepis diminuta TaxID=6216 RepID=A0A564YKF0_HYMDI|nr:unnamed protein product [Hymenolepis diminuta]
MPMLFKEEKEPEIKEEEPTQDESRKEKSIQVDADHKVQAGYGFLGGLLGLVKTPTSSDAPNQPTESHWLILPATLQTTRRLAGPNGHQPITMGREGIALHCRNRCTLYLTSLSKQRFAQLKAVVYRDLLRWLPQPEF